MLMNSSVTITPVGSTAEGNAHGETTAISSIPWQLIIGVLRSDSFTMRYPELQLMISQRDSKVCQLYLIGACDYGNGCFRMHILPDSPTLTFPARRPDSAPQTSLVSEVHAGAADTKTIPSEKLEEANTDQVENCVVGALVVEAEQVVQDTNIPTVGRPADDTSPIDNMAQPEVNHCSVQITPNSRVLSVNS